MASWARYAEGVDEQGEPIDVQDQLAETLVPLAKSQRENPTAFIENTRCSATSHAGALRRSVHVGVDSLHRDGARATLESLVREGDGMTVPARRSGRWSSARR